MKSNFEFLKDNFPVLANFGELAEKYLYSDSNSCLMKLGMIGETIVNLIFTYDRISLPYDNTAVNRIDTLFREGMITRDLVDILHALRKIRNKAVHENYASVDDGKTLIQMAYSLTEWFMQTYGDWNYECKAFVMPSEKTEPVIVNKESEQKEEEKLIAAASEVAAAAPVVAKEDRKKQAGKAASQRIKSEAETRYLIDEQLRKVGWEADTEHLRYSKGTRPAKGRNIAIAEWPTDSTVGNKGYADYALFIDNQLVATIEAKAIHKDIPSVIDYQCKDYSRNIRSEDAKYQIGTWGNYKVPFTFATNGRPYLEQYDTKSGVWFLDLREPDNAPKVLKGWMSPTGMLEQLEKDIAARNKALRDMPYDLLRDKDGLNLREYRLKKGDIVMGRRGEMGRSAPVSENEAGWLCGTGSLIIRLKEGYNSSFYSQIIASHFSVQYLEENCVGSTMKNLNEKVIKSLPVPNYTKEQQQRIVAILDSVLEKEQQAKDIAEAVIDQIDTMKKAVLARAFRGELGTNDPAEESAMELLRSVL